MSDEIKPALSAIVEHALSEASHSGAGMGDYPDAEGIVAEIIAALGFTQEDVDLLRAYAVRVPGRAETFDSLADRIAALLPPK